MIKFDPFWTDQIQKNKNKTVIFILSVNVTTFYSNIFWLVRNPIWSSLIHFGQIWSKKSKNKTVIFTLSVTFYSNIFWLVRNPIWSNLIHFGRIWSKKNQNHTKSCGTWTVLCIILCIWTRKRQNQSDCWFHKVKCSEKPKNNLIEKMHVWFDLFATVVLIMAILCMPEMLGWKS